MANPCGGGRELSVPPWAGPWAWLEEIQRQRRVMQCRSGHHRRFVATARQLTAARIRAPWSDPAAVARILPLLEATRRNCGRRLFGEQRPWSDGELGELLVESRNRLTLARLGRARPRSRGARFELEQIPGDRLDWLIQRHPNLELVDRLRAERHRRASTTTTEERSTDQ